MKRTVSFIVAIIMCMSILPGSAVAAGATDYAQGVPVAETTKHICLMDANTGAVLYEKDGYSKAYPASTTKIMTCILALELCENLDEVVNVGSSFDKKGSLMGFVNNEELRIIDLIYGTMLVSGNDAASALAVHIAGSQDQFAVLMNNKAAEIGMKHTHFVKANGLHNDDHYTTAYDMALLGRYAMQNDTFREIVGSKKWDVPPSEWDSDGYKLENSNKLLHTKDKDREKGLNFKYEYATGIKTGDTDQAGRCLVASAEKNGVELILVLFGDPQGDASRNLRFENAPKFFEWGFANYATVSASQLGLESTVNIPVSNGSFDSEGGLCAQVDFSDKVIAGTRAFIDDLIANKAGITSTKALRDGTDALVAPISTGEEVGTIVYSYNGSEILTVPLIASNCVDEIGNVIEPDASSSPILAEDSDNDQGSPWLFWTLIIIAALAILLIIRIILLRGSRRRRRPRSLRSRSRSRFR